MLCRFIVAFFLLSAVCGAMSASVAVDDAELTEKFEKDEDLDDSSKSVNETTQDIKIRDVTAQLTNLNANVTDTVPAANSTKNVTASVKSINQNMETTTPKVALHCETTTCSIKNGITTCRTTHRCTAAKSRMNNTTEKVTTTTKAPVLDDA